MQVSIISFNETKARKDFRIDAEYFQPRFQKIEKLLSDVNTLPLEHYASFIKKGIFDISPDNYVKRNGIPFIRSGDLKDALVPASSALIHISKTTHFAEMKTALSRNDLVIAKVGTIGDVALNDKYDEANFSQNVIGVKIKEEYKSISGFLMIYLNSFYGQGQISRVLSGQVQQKLTLEDIRSVNIVDLSERIKRLCAGFVEQACDLRNDAGYLLDQAQALLLTELGLLNWKPKHQLSFIKSRTDMDQAERMDAEYFQPKYDEIVEVIKRYSGGWDTLENICELVGHPSNPPYASTEDKDKTFIITQKHLGDFSLNDEFWKDDNALYTTDDFIDKHRQFLLKSNDVLLYSVGAYIGKANIYLEDIKATIGSFLTLLRVKEDKLNGYVLMVFLNSDVGIMMSKQHQRGMAQQYLYPYDIRTFPVPLVKDEVQERVQQLVMEAFNSRRQSKHLLECAKQSVEITIEQDEETAIKWLEKEVVIDE